MIFIELLYKFCNKFLSYIHVGFRVNIYFSYMQIFGYPISLPQSSNNIRLVKNRKGGSDVSKIKMALLKRETTNQQHKGKVCMYLAICTST